MIKTRCVKNSDTVALEMMANLSWSHTIRRGWRSNELYNVLKYIN